MAPPESLNASIWKLLLKGRVNVPILALKRLSSAYLFLAVDLFDNTTLYSSKGGYLFTNRLQELNNGCVIIILAFDVVILVNLISCGADGSDIVAVLLGENNNSEYTFDE